ncbi:CrcB family protein [Streptomyces sp. HNM0574]|uniref:fluoride efflux transporter FluC n=1 Tax=Streptomyces sp. HNM0574 TaxID=2714954 RepID=UPI0019D0C97A|nr:CrcB family protein [Streptomyces sp. HNM0574]
MHVPAQRAETEGRRAWGVLGAVAAGGALGALARFGLTRLLPPDASGFPWGVFVVNLLGCALIGVLMVLVSEGGRAGRAHPLVRPFLGVGVLGGFTTFSTYAVDVALLLERGPAAAGAALAYLLATPVGALAAVWAAAAATRAVLARGGAP